MNDMANGNGPTAAIVKALVVLAWHGVPSDVQELLVRGDPSRGIPPGALQSVLDACVAEAAAKESFDLCAAIDYGALGDILGAYPDSTPVNEVEELGTLSVGGLTVLAARAESFSRWRDHIKG